MKRLAPKNINTAQEYDRIFTVRSMLQTDWNDQRRWELLFEKYTGGNLIDLGCLDSYIPIWAREKYPNAGIWAIDQSEKCIEGMRERTKGENIIYEVGDVYNLRFPDTMFDYVVAGELIEHLEEPDLAIKESFRILKQNGILAISTPCEEEKEPGAIDLERHLWSFNKYDIIKFMKPYARKIKIKILRSQYFPVYKYAWPTIICCATKR